MKAPGVPTNCVGIARGLLCEILSTVALSPDRHCKLILSFQRNGHVSEKTVHRADLLEERILHKIRFLVPAEAVES